VPESSDILHVSYDAAELPDACNTGDGAIFLVFTA
jgi:hypothetical protein